MSFNIFKKIFKKSNLSLDFELRELYNKIAVEYLSVQDKIIELKLKEFDKTINEKESQILHILEYENELRYVRLNEIKNEYRKLSWG